MGFDNTCTNSGKLNISRVLPRFYRWVCKTLRLSPLVVEHSVVVMRARLNPMVANIRLLFYERCVQNQWLHKLLRPFEDADTGGPSSVTVRMEYLCAFQY